MSHGQEGCLDFVFGLKAFETKMDFLTWVRAFASRCFDSLSCMRGRASGGDQTGVCVQAQQRALSDRWLLLSASSFCSLELRLCPGPRLAFIHANAKLMLKTRLPVACECFGAPLTA